MRASPALLVLALLLAGCSSAPPAAPSRACRSAALGSSSSGNAAAATATAVTADGVILRGRVWNGSGSPSHAVLLIHGLNEDAHSYDAFAESLGQRGFTVAAWDLRGHGQSTVRNGQPYNLRNFTERDVMAMAGDVALELGILEQGAPACAAIVGASIGANLALRAIAMDPNVSAAVLLSPGLDYHGLTTSDLIGQVQDRRILLAAARQDSYAFQSAAQLASGLSHASFLQIEGSTHGTNLLREGDLQPRLIAWLLEQA